VVGRRVRGEQFQQINRVGTLAARTAPVAVNRASAERVNGG
jgi:hypothetical protein